MHTAFSSSNLLLLSLPIFFYVCECGRFSWLQDVFFGVCVCAFVSVWRVYESVYAREHQPLLKVWLRHSRSLHHQSALWCLSASPRTPTASPPLFLSASTAPPPKCLAEGGERRLHSFKDAASDSQPQFSRLISSFVGTNMFDG